MHHGEAPGPCDAARATAARARRRPPRARGGARGGGAAAWQLDLASTGLGSYRQTANARWDAAMGPATEAEELGQ
jgi:hypothetical protein